MMLLFPARSVVAPAASLHAQMREPCVPCRAESIPGGNTCTAAASLHCCDLCKQPGVTGQRQARTVKMAAKNGLLLAVRCGIRSVHHPMMPRYDVQAEEAQAMARQMVDVYAEFAVNGAAMPVIAGAPPQALQNCRQL